MVHLLYFLPFRPPSTYTYHLSIRKPFVYFMTQPSSCYCCCCPLLLKSRRWKTTISYSVHDDDADDYDDDMCYTVSYRIYIKQSKFYIKCSDSRKKNRFKWYIHMRNSIKRNKSNLWLAVCNSFSTLHRVNKNPITHSDLKVIINCVEHV